MWEEAGDGKNEKGRVEVWEEAGDGKDEKEESCGVGKGESWGVRRGRRWEG